MMSSPTPDPGYDRILQEHQALKSLLDQIREALRSKNASIDEVSVLLARLGDQLIRHFSAEEEGGYFSEALLHAPQLVARANDLMAQHPKMCTRARDLVVQLGPSQPTDDWWQQTRERFDAFCGELLRHESRENRLIQEAYNRDMGPSD